jgi:putative FmdB family regulatory protein
MPTYVYQCKECGLEFEKYHSITKRPIIKCPSCKGKTKRLISGGGGIIFRGSGFYSNDYKNKKPSKKEGVECDVTHPDGRKEKVIGKESD